MTTARGRGRVALAARTLAAVVIASGAVAAAGDLAGSRSALAAPTAGACVGDSGVTVVVDFGPLGGGTVTRCAPEPVSSGFDALTRAGFTYTGTARYPGLLCRIDGKPTPQQESCQGAPSPAYYWAYWTASSPGAPWTYSDMGAGNRDPAPGSVEGWAFSDGCRRQPGGSCGAAPATTTTTAAGSPPTTRTAPGGTPSTGATVAQGGGAGSAGSTATTAVDAVTTGDVTSTSTTAIDDDAPPTSDEADEAAALPSEGGDRPGDDSSGTRDGSGSPLGLVAGLAVAAALGLGALARRHRRTDVDGRARLEAGQP